MEAFKRNLGSAVIGLTYLLYLGSGCSDDPIPRNPPVTVTARQQPPIPYNKKTILAENPINQLSQPSNPYNQSSQTVNQYEQK